MDIDRALLPPALFEFVVISDTHFILDAEAYAIEFDSVRQWPARAAWAFECAARLQAELLIHLGDLSEEPPIHAHHASSREAAMERIGALGLEPIFAAGNMDIGDKPDPTMFQPPVTEDSLEWYYQRFGPSWHSFDRGPCHFVIVNSQILNSTLPAAEEQMRWLETDLATHDSERILLFLHMPPFFVAEDEPHTGFYNSIDEPARSWLTALMRQHHIEAVFCGHTHFRALNRAGATRIHVCPSTTTSRAGFYEAFTVAPPPEQGRNDPDKLGFYLVRVMMDGVRPYFIRTAGATDSHEEQPPRLLMRSSPDLPESRMGLDLRLPIATEAAGALAWPSVKRQRVRDDHPLLCAIEMGARHVRVPESDLSDSLQSERLRVLKDEGVELTAHFVWTPEMDLPARVDAAHLQPDILELQMPGRDLPDAAILEALRALRANCDVGLSLAPLLPHERIPGRYHPRGRLGFRMEELVALDATLTEGGVLLQRALCVLEGADPWTAMCDLPELHAIDGFDVVYNLDDLEEDDRAWQLTRALAALAVRESLRLFLDPYVDLDRTNDLRSGLLDRLGNPHPLFHVAGVLNTLLFSEANWQNLHTDDGEIALTSGSGRHLRLVRSGEGMTRGVEEGAVYHLETGRHWMQGQDRAGPLALFL
ncbi:MAG: hypothetical protein HOM68_15345 [Gemmatimonadetes bacterium]|jgi:predicted phosphodiesterase|nr:hypothetical protein [Gemmatimonadota bacterium]MBT5057917.1 hypothetical protein [Gemmatimonadota bacterium]MBT5144357.1 hypothetical protein [Gemmatimonadota bacterium]MBT5587125.1 hypothetical protein [Gemmatimonadota bacterium]MBT5960393.1 hypothetical protein [Gemmatimonadota bacterium]